MSANPTQCLLGQGVPIADLGSIACFVNTLDFDLAVHPSIISAEGLKKAMAISRFGSVFDVAARELLGGLGGAGMRSHQSREHAQIDDVVDDRIVREIETGGFSERIYR